MTPDRKQHSAAFWITVALVAVLVAYPLSAGPVGLIYNQLGRPHWMYTAEWYAYGPLFWSLERGPDWLRQSFRAYVYWWCPA